MQSADKKIQILKKAFLQIVINITKFIYIQLKVFKNIMANNKVFLIEIKKQKKSHFI